MHDLLDEGIKALPPHHATCPPGRSVCTRPIGKEAKIERSPKINSLFIISKQLILILNSNREVL
jgi:hypothetical protein